MNSTFGGGIVFFDNNGAGGAVTSLNNGLTLTAGVGQLGGPLIQNTTVDASTFLLRFESDNGTDSVAVSMISGIFGISAGNGTGDLSNFQVSDNAIVFSLGDNASGSAVGIFGDGGIAVGTPQEARFGTFALGSGNAIKAVINQQLTVIDDIFQTGIVKDPAITKSNQLANQNAYVTTDCLGSSLAGSINQRLQTALNTTFLLYAVPIAADQLLSVNIGFILNNLSPTTNVQVELDYTDETSTAHAVTVINTSVLLSPQVSPIVIYAQKGTNVNIKVSLNIAGANYNLYATAQYLGIQN